jgi:hypothetical protein
MKNLLTVNFIEKFGKCNKEELIKMLQLQIENSLNLLWKIEDIVVLTNFDFEFMGIKAMNIGLNDFCITGSKMFGVLWYFETQKINETIWSHDCDCLQNVYFDEKDLAYGETYFSKKDPNILNWERYDVGACYYSRQKFNGGSIFWKPTSIDIIKSVVDTLKLKNAKKEEPILNKFLRSKEYENRVAVLNSSLNLGCSGFCPRYERSMKPIKVHHFHPNNSIAWETHVLDRSGIGGRISSRLETLIRSYYPTLATNLSDKGKIRREQKIMERKNANRDRENANKERENENKKECS